MELRSEQVGEGIGELWWRFDMVMVGGVVLGWVGGVLGGGTAGEQEWVGERVGVEVGVGGEGERSEEEEGGGDDVVGELVGGGRAEDVGVE
ncbi:hypothetical protein, partial [Prescottella equi]|uniref:hypothetical protein n=1 Tax=Rhodococcus hoagii TaxID=43767 RepID=UPI001C92E957